MMSESMPLRPAQLLMDHKALFDRKKSGGPILDLACGEGHNGIFLATKGLSVLCCDISKEPLARAKKLASAHQADVEFWQVDLEGPEGNPFREEIFGGILVFRYLHRPLIPCIKKALVKGGLLFYETFTIEQPRYGKPHNPDFLLKRGELCKWFEDWEIFHHFEGTAVNPKRAIAQIVCKKPDNQ